MKNANQLEIKAKKPIVYKLELETYLANVQEKADKISDKFIIIFFALGICLAPIYDTWTFTLANSVIIAALYAIARFVLTNKFYARMIISLVYAIFMLQFIGQMHGMAEAHFFFFTNIVLLIIYQDWRIMIPYTVFAIGHHSVLAILQANPDVFHLENANLPNYFIGYSGRTLEGATVDYITTFQLFFHFGLASMIAFVCGWWANILRNNSIELMEKQLETQAQNEELSSSEEELRQNSEQLQNTNDQLYVIQREIEEKQRLLNKAEKIANLASYEIDLVTQKLTHSNNLPLIYGEDSNKIESMARITDMLHIEDVNKYNEVMREVAEGKAQTYDVSYRAKGKNFDEYRYYRAVGEVVKDAMNNPEKLVGTVQDVTTEVKQKQEVEKAYQKIQASEEELQQNYEELQIIQEQLLLVQSLIDNSQDAIQASRADGKFVYINKVAAERLGISSKECANYFVSDIEAIFKEKGSWEAHVEEVKQLGGITIEGENTHRTTGETFPVEVGVSYVEINGEGYIMASSRDITERKKAEEERLKIEHKIKLNNNKLQNLIENVGDLVFLLDANEFVFKEYYASSDKDLAFEPSSFLQKRITDINFTETPLQIIVKALEKAKQTKEKSTAEYQLDLPSGTEWFSLIVSPILNEQKEVEEILCVTRNITYIKRTEIAVQQQNQLLSQQKENIESAFNELQTTQNQLIQSEKMASLGQLIANIAHEINTPLGAIRSSAVSIEEILNIILPSLPSFSKKLDNHIIYGFNDFVELSIKKTDSLSSREKRTIKYDLIDELNELKIHNPEDYADWIVDMNMHDEKTLFMPLLNDKNAKEIFQIAYQLSSVIRSNQTIKAATDRAAKIVFALKNYVHQDQTDEKIAVNINESIEITLTLYHNQIKHAIDVTRDFGDIPEFMGYPDELVQVWTNIIHNALQAMKNKGRLFIQTSVENNNVLVCIQDTGGGIPKEVQDRVFDAFFTTKSAGQGSGLGLDITKKIIEKHNGKIWFDSLGGKGTTFFIELPLTDK